MPLTDAQLTGIAAQAANMAKLDIERGRFGFLIAAYSEGEALHRMTKVERLIVDRLGENWLKDGRAKDLAFSSLRQMVEIAPPDAFVFASIVNSFEPAAGFAQLTATEQKELLEGGHDAHHEAVRQGALSVCDALAVTVQSRERVCSCSQKLGRRGEFLGQPRAFVVPQETFRGRMKMFGGGDHAAA